jgi:hypothetical protein
MAVHQLIQAAVDIDKQNPRYSIDMVLIVLPARLAEFELRSPEKQKDKTPSRWSV